MKRFFSFLLITALAFGMLGTVSFAAGENIIPEKESTMAPDSAWGTKFGGELFFSAVALRGDSNNKVLHFTRKNGSSKSWYSPTLNIAEYLKKDTAANGDGTYKIEFDFCITDENGDDVNIGCKFRADSEASFAKEASGDKSEYRGDAGRIEVSGADGKWHHFANSFSCEKNDFNSMKSLLFCFDAFKDTTTEVYLDNFSIVRTGSEKVTVERGTVTEIEGAKIESPKVIKPRPPQKFEEDTSNLISVADSEFEVSDVSKTTWTKMGSAAIKIDGEGLEGKCLFSSNIANSWSSPMLEISRYVESAGTYSFGMMIKFDIEDDNKHDISLMIRGNEANSFITQHGGNLYSDATKFKIQSGIWNFICIEFTVTEDDLQAINKKTQWNIALSNLPTGIKSIKIDNAEMIMAGKDSLSQKGSDKIAEANKEANKELVNSRAENTQKVEFDESLFNAMKTTAVITVIIAAVVIFIKIRKAKK